MAKMKDGIFGSFSGKIGNVVGCEGKTGFYVRSRPVHVSNPRTERQQAHRAKFSLSIKLAQTLTPFLRTGYREVAPNGRPFYAAVSCILKNAVVLDGTDYAIDFDKVLVSRGSLTMIHHAKATLVNGKVVYSWTDNSDEGNASASDVALFVVFNKTRWMAVYDDSGASRSDEHADFMIPADWANDEMAMYIGFRSKDGGTVANSICILYSIA